MDVLQRMDQRAVDERHGDPGTIDERIHRLVLGSAAEHAELALGGVPFGPPTVLGDSLLLLVYDKPEEGSLKSFDFALKSVRWSREAPGGWSSAQPVVWRDCALAGSTQGKLSAFAPNGSEQWSDVVGRAIRGVGVTDRVLYVGTQGGTVYAYRPPAAGVQK